MQISGLKKQQLVTINDVSDYLLKLDRVGKIDLSKIFPGEFRTLCELILEADKSLRNPTSLQTLIKLTQWGFTQ